MKKKEVFLEFNLPEPLKQHVDRILKFKDVERYELNEDKIKFIGYFNSPKLIEFINKLYQKEYNKFNKRSTINLSKIIKKVLKR